MRELLHRTFLQTLPLLVAFAAMGLLAGSEPLQEILATSIAPAYTQPSEDELLVRAKKRCEESRWSSVRDGCSFNSSKERTEAISWEKWYASLAYESQHIKPNVKLLASASAVAGTVFGLLFAIVWVRRLYRHLKEYRMPGTPRVFERLAGLFRAFQSRKAEHDFMRYKRLFDSGLLSEDEFERAKRELKPKILQGRV